jgi:uncharacterized membrane protein
MTPRLILYVRADQPAGRRARRWSDSLQAEYPHELEVRDVAGRPEWKDAAGDSIPAAEVDGRRLSAPLTEVGLKSALAVARAIGEYRQEIRAPAAAKPAFGGADRLARWFSRHWLAVFNAFLGVYLGLAVLAPILMKAGAAEPAAWIYGAYKFTCHELGFRSFYLFGEKVYYPRDEFQADTGIDPNDLFAARDFYGSERLGYKLALCQRDLAIYVSLLLAGIAYHFLRRRLKPLHWILWVLIGILPMGLDGGTQLISYLPLGILPPRESTPLLRVITGALFGIACVWFAYPYVQEGMETETNGPPAGNA